MAWQRNDSAKHNSNIELNVYPLTRFGLVLNQFKKEMQNDLIDSFSQWGCEMAKINEQSLYLFIQKCFCEGFHPSRSSGGRTS